MNINLIDILMYSHSCRRPLNLLWSISRSAIVLSKCHHSTMTVSVSVIYLRQHSPSTSFGQVIGNWLPELDSTSGTFPLSTNLLCTMGLVPMTLGQESLRYIASVSDSLSVGSPVSVESGDLLSDADPQGCQEGVDCIGDMSDLGSMLEAYCVDGVHP